MKKFALAFGLLGILGAIGATGVGCGKDACTAFGDDLASKYSSCGVTVTSGSASTSVSATCTDAQAKQASCLDACLPKADCDCLKNPVMSGCVDKQKDYNDCNAACLK